MKRIPEYFGEQPSISLDSVASVPPRLLRQERDWTCSVACIRTILSAMETEIPSENDFIQKYALEVGGHYTEEILQKKMFGKNKNIVTKRDFPHQDISPSTLNKLLQEKYLIMAECMYNYAHWVVILGYFSPCNRCDIEEHQILLYDPYYDMVRLVIADEFFTMWCDPSGHKQEFIAVKKN